jgi:hypothetical protein
VAPFGVSVRCAGGVTGDEPKTGPSKGGGDPLMDRLDSWKEIAAYPGRGIRTVRRWEREEELPVRRLAHDKRGTIYARRDELASWWESRRLTLAVQAGPDTVGASAVRSPERVTWTAALTNWPALSSDARLIAFVSDAGMTARGVRGRQLVALKSLRP